MWRGEGEDGSEDLNTSSNAIASGLSMFFKKLLPQEEGHVGSAIKAKMLFLNRDGGSFG